MPLQDDLYKCLVDESRTYREKVSSIWLHKFTMLGAIIAFAAIRTEAQSQNPELIAAAILSLPLIAILLDVKLAEFGIHARVIDDFIIQNFSDPPVISAWEKTKWGSPHTLDRGLVICRSIATVAVTTIPTCVIAILSVLAAKPFLPKPVYRRLPEALLCFCLVYVLLAVISGPLVLFRHNVSHALASTDNKAGGPPVP
jgi:hypothetical protein